MSATITLRLAEADGASAINALTARSIRLFHADTYGNHDVEEAVRHAYGVDDAIENGVIDVNDSSLKDRIAELTATRDQAKGHSVRALNHIVKIGPAITPKTLRAFAAALRKKLRNGDGTFARDQVRAVAQ